MHLYRHQSLDDTRGRVLMALCALYVPGRRVSMRQVAQLANVGETQVYGIASWLERNGYADKRGAQGVPEWVPVKRADGSPFVRAAA